MEVAIFMFSQTHAFITVAHSAILHEENHAALVLLLESELNRRYDNILEMSGTMEPLISMDNQGNISIVFVNEAGTVTVIYELIEVVTF